VQSHDVRITLTGALGLTGPPLVAFVGGGGKTTALRRLCEELAAPAGEAPPAPSGVIATTTTAMLERQLAAAGPLVLDDEDPATLATRAGEALRGSPVVALAATRVQNGKVRGLPPARVDGLWRAGVAGAVVVEADGSRGLSLKAFGEAEPQVPSAATTVVVVAGLDVLGRPLDDGHVHRAALLASRLGAAEGVTVGPPLLAAGLALQVVRIRELAPAADVVALLNKAEGDHRLRQAAEVAALLTDEPAGGASARPDQVVAGSVREGAYHVLYGAPASHAADPPAHPGHLQRVLGVVLAAGMATRMGGSKVTLPVRGRPMVVRVVDAALASRLAGTLVVVGHEADGVRALVRDRPVRVVRNRAFAEGLSTSVHAAVRNVGPDFEAAMFLLADQPFLTPPIIDRLLDAYASTGRPIVRPETDGRPGNPVLFSARLFPELLRETGDKGGRDVVRRHAGEVCLVPVVDPLAGLDIDSPEDYERSREGRTRTP
jgi:molybdenum cofactor cytidylyltransferase